MFVYGGTMPALKEPGFAGPGGMAITSVLSAGSVPEQEGKSKGRGHLGSYRLRNSQSSIPGTCDRHVRRYGPRNGQSSGACHNGRYLSGNGERSGARYRWRSRLRSRLRYSRRYGAAYSPGYVEGYDAGYGASYDERCEERTCPKQKVRCRDEGKR
jgi:hypothetical protein